MAPVIYKQARPAEICAEADLPEKIKAMDCSSINDQGCTLVRKIASRIEDESLGTFTVSIYDIAWVSMISKAGNGVEHWIIKQ